MYPRRSEAEVEWRAETMAAVVLGWNILGLNLGMFRNNGFGFPVLIGVRNNEEIECSWNGFLLYMFANIFYQRQRFKNDIAFLEILSSAKFFISVLMTII